jgi:hypothetical protein
MNDNLVSIGIAIPLWFVIGYGFMRTNYLECNTQQKAIL